MAVNDSSVEVFRLAALRSPQPGVAARKRISLAPEALGSAEISRSGRSGKPPSGYVAGDPRTGLPVPEDPKALSLPDLDAVLRAQDDLVAPKAVTDWVKSATGSPVKSLVASPEFVALKSYVHGSFLSVLNPEADLAAPEAGGLAQARDSLLRAVRLISLLEALADPATGPKDAAAVREHVRYVTVILPDSWRRPADALSRPPVIADLKLVKLGPARYEPGGIAHVENVMAREKRDRSHRTLDRSELTVITETERTEEREQDLSTTSRAEVLQESSKALHEALNLEAGLSVSASYGPTVSAQADARVARATSSDEVNRTASTFANEVLKRTRERIVERAFEQRVLKQVHETEEINTHGFDNTGASSKHLSGVYRWVDSVQESWIENYGKRLMLELVVPEPAAFVRWAVSNVKPAMTAGDPPEKPHDPGAVETALEPGHITAANYASLAARYGATNVSPPPADTLELGAACKPEGTSDLYLYSNAETLKVPVGYRATSWEAQCVTWGSGSPDGEVWMAGVGSMNGIAEDNSGVLRKTLSGALDIAEKSAIPVVMLGRGLINMAAAVRVHCELTAAGRAKWQISVYDAIMTAYREALAAYESRKAEIAAALALGVALDVDSGNPTENRLVERRELRRGVIHMLLGHPEDQGVFTGDAVVRDETGAPGLDLAIAGVERDAILFHEQAFEWSNMTWVHYPYYWADRDRWQEDCRRSGSDPAWTSFMTSGAARVVVPVRPGFEAAVALYLATGIMWAGGQVPTVGDPAYLAIDDEVVESLGTGVVDDEARTRTPLEPVRLPTSLVWLQPSPDLNLAGA